MKSIEVTETSYESFKLNGEEFFPRGSTLGTKKTIGLKPEEDVQLEFSQGQ